MCGICGILNFKEDNSVDEDLLKKMTSILYHRGPDDEGYFIDKNFGFGMRRLSIIDLETGKQPIFNERKNLVIIYNGEIYNYKELKENLLKKKHNFYTKSDTEVILHLYEEYKENCLNYLRGMFAIAIYDILNKELFLARDEIGIKPLYYFFSNNSFIFSSEIKSILVIPSVKREINLQSLDRYLTYLYDPSEETMFCGIKKIQPGNFAYINSKGIKIKNYFNINYEVQKYKKEDLLEKTEYILRESIKKHLVSDVEVGSFLSGGIDSSLISAMMSKIENRKIKTFSIGFKEGYYNELPFAKIVADEIKSEHYEFFVKSDALNVLPEIIWYLDEPLADASVVPNYYVAKCAKDYVKVVLTGLGGDEIFAGYQRYLGNNYMKYYKKFPKFIRDNFKKIISIFPADGTSKIKNYIRLVKKMMLGLDLDIDEMYIKWNTYFDKQDKIKIFSKDIHSKIKNIDSFSYAKKYFNKKIDDFLWNAQYTDLKTYLPGDILFLTDRMTMAHSLEARVPFVDKEITNFTYSIPSDLKIYRNKTKYILREIAKKYVPTKIANREKHGFAVPIDLWLKKDLKYIFEKIFSKERVKKLGFFNYEEIYNIYNIHLSGKEDLSQYLWALLVFDVWHKMFIEENITSFNNCSLKDLY